MEDFGTAGAKLLPNIRHLCIGKFKPYIFIPVRRYPVHYLHYQRQKGSKKADNTNLI